MATETNVSTTAPALPAWSSMQLISVNLTSLLEEIIKSSDVPEPCQKEALAHLTAALEQCKLAKKSDMLGQLEYAILYAKKASKLMDELFELRKEQYPEY